MFLIDLVLIIVVISYSCSGLTNSKVIIIKIDFLTIFLKSSKKLKFYNFVKYDKKIAQLYIKAKFSIK